MAGPKIYSGHRPNGGGGTPDLLHVNAGLQRAYIPELLSGSTTVIWYAMQGRVGSTGGTKRGRFYAAYTGSGQGSGGSGSRVPGNVISNAYTNEFTTNEVFNGSNEGETTPELSLNTPFTSDRNAGHAHGATSRDNGLVIGMTQVASLPSVHNSWLYDRNAKSDGTPNNGYTSTVNAGHAAIWKIGEANVAPSAPTGTLPASGASETTLTPNISGDFNDANKTLNDGRAWDYAWQTRIEVREGTDVIWDFTYTTTSAERTNHRTVRRYAGPALSYYTTYSYRIRHRDRAGEWGTPSDWVYFSISHNNRPPNTPRNFSGLGTRNGSRTITVGADFTDPDYPTLPNGQTYERFESKQIIVRRASDNVVVYNSGIVSTSSSERSNARSSTSYTLPAWDVTYRWYERHFDRRGEASAYASATVIAQSGGSVDMPTQPSGRVTNMVNPGDIRVVYRSTSGTNGDRIRVGLFWESGGGPRSQRDVARTVTPGSTNVIAWADLWSDISVPGFPFQEPGTTWLIGVRVRDVNGNWTEWSDLQEISLNARPTTPTLFGPGSDPRGTIPALSVRASDPDQPNNELTVTIEIADSSDNVLGSAVAPFNTGHNTNVFTLPVATVSSIIGGVHGTYSFRANASDGYLASGWSGSWEFTYVEAPNVTITSPGGPVVETMQPLFEWDTTGQNRYRVRGYNLDNDLVYDTGEVTSIVGSHTISADQYWIGGERWNRDETFVWEVGVRDGTGLWGWSSQLELTLEYTPPEPLIVDIAAMSLPGVKGTHYAQATISEPEVGTGDFIRTIVDRVEIDGPDGNEIPGTLVENRFIAGSPGVTEFADFDVTSHQWYRWTFRYEVQVGIDVIESDPVYAEMMVSWHGTLLHMPFDPLEQYVWLQYGAPGGRYEPRRHKSRHSNTVHPMHSALPLGYSGRSQNINIDGEYTLLDRGDMTALQQYDVLDRMFDYQDHDKSPDGRPHGMCWREGRGGRNGRIYVELMDFEDVPFYQESQVVTLAFEARAHRLGED